MVGRYRVLGKLGEGGMGRVWLGCGPDGRLVAVKQVHAQFAMDPGFRARFRREVDASRAVSGAYTASVVDADPEAEVPWLASVFVPGPSLRQTLDSAGPLPEEAVLRLAAGLAAGLADIHRAGLVHRDVKPSNVLLAPDGPRVIDFGIARAADGEGGRGQLTRSGWLVGSPGFVSPEQAEGRELAPASDVFSLGSVLAAACAGNSPFAGSSTVRTLSNIVQGEPDLGRVPGRLLLIVQACLAKDPAARPTPAEVLAMAGPQPPAAEPWPEAVRQQIAVQRDWLAWLSGPSHGAPAWSVAEGRTDVVGAQAWSGPVGGGWGPQPPPVAAPMPNRRKFLWIAGIGAGVAAVAGGAVAVALAGNSHADQAGESPTSAPVPKGPAPTWSRAVATHYAGGLGLMGDVLVRWDRKTAQAFDAATGAPRWTIGRPDGVSEGTLFDWFGVHGSSLIGQAYMAETATFVLFAIGPDGKQQLRHDNGDNNLREVLGLYAESTAVLAIEKAGGPDEIVAITWPDCVEMWRRPIKSADRVAAIVGQTCYLQDDTDTVCLDQSGTQRWATPNTCTGTDPRSIAIAGDVLAIAGDQLVVLNPTTGVPRKMALGAGFRIMGVGVSGIMTLVVGQRTQTGSGEYNDTVWGIDQSLGTKRWGTRMPFSLGEGLTTSGNWVFVPTVDSGSTPPAGFLVLNGDTGAIAWAGPGGSTTDWDFCATDDPDDAGSNIMVYAASDTTVYAYRNPR
jgi:hypothetical protein